MPAIVTLPQVVEDLLAQFGDVFPNEPARVHFAEYVTGLVAAEYQMVSGNAREFADAPDQSCLNRFLTESPWESERLNAPSAWTGSSMTRPRAIARTASFRSITP